VNAIRERCPYGEGQLQCILPAGHAGDVHEYVAVLPPEINRMIATRVDELDRQLAYWRKQNRWYRWLLAGTAAACLINVYAAGSSLGWW